MTTTSTEIVDREALRRTVAEVLDVDVSEVGDDTHFVDDLGVDSLMALEVVVVLENRYGVRLREDELRRVTCLRSAHDLLVAKLAEQG